MIVFGGTLRLPMPRKRTRTEAPTPEQRERRERVDAIKEALRREIRSQGLTEKEVAARLGYGKSFLSNIFTEHPSREATHLRVETLLGILDVLGLEAGPFLIRVEQARRLAGGEGRPVSGLAALPLATAQGPSLEHLGEILTLAGRAEQLPASALQDIFQATLDFMGAWAKVLGGARGEVPGDASKS